jgi:hypothetical protein
MGREGVPPLTGPSSASPKSAFLTDTLAALSKRRKALRHKLRHISVERVLERTEGNEWEKLEVSCEALGPRLRLFVWQDRWVFVDARTPTKEGWAWEFTTQGRLVGGVEARALVAALEATIEASFLESSAALERVWTPLLATGPRPVT